MMNLQTDYKHLSCTKFNSSKDSVAKKRHVCLPKGDLYSADV